MGEPTPAEIMVQRILEGRAPQPLRSAAARGALPLPPATLVRLGVFLLQDSEESIRSEAENSLTNLDSDTLQEALAETACPTEVMEHFAKRASREEKLAERIAFHPDAPATAISVLATGGSSSIIELVLTNQERLLRQPAILDCMMLNPAVRADQHGRILELVERAAKLQQKRKAEVADGAEVEEEPQLDFEEAAKLLQVDVGELLSASEILGAEELEHHEDEAVRNAFQIIVTLNTAQKALLAMKGGREERMILIRDSNKTVSLGVLKNPRMNESEIEAIAKMRNVTDEVLRQIGNHRDWVKNYTVVTSLVYNPRTPQGVSTNFIPRLTNRDLKNLANSRDVPELIRRMARRTHDTRTQRANRGFKKK
ncbi:MAG: hypothetical protein GY716_21475 [bacterium]|nr:hypothetical protein [bacterium]